MVYELLDMLEVTSELLTFTLLILYPLSEENVMTAFVPSVTVNVFVLFLMVVPSYVAEPLPVALIDNV